MSCQYCVLGSVRSIIFNSMQGRHRRRPARAASVVAQSDVVAPVDVVAAADVVAPTVAQVDVVTPADLDVQAIVATPTLDAQADVNASAVVVAPSVAQVDVVTPAELGAHVVVAASAVGAQANVVAITPVRPFPSPMEVDSALFQICPCCTEQRSVNDFVHPHRSGPYPNCALCRVRILSSALCFVLSLTMCRATVGGSL